MKIRAERRALTEAVTWVAAAVSKRPAAPVLSGLRLVAEGETLTMQAFDYEVSHTARIAVDVASEGEALVPAAFLRSVLSGMKGTTVELVLDDPALTITCGRSTYRCRVMRLEDYPALPAMPAVVGEIPGETLTNLVAATSWPVDDASPHAQVRGLHLETEDGDLVCVGASRFCIAEARAAGAWDEHFAATVPAKGLAAALKGLGDTGGVVQVGHDGKESGLLGLSDGERSVTLRTYAEGQFVDWRRLIRPDGDPVTWTADAAELLGAVKRAGGLLADDGVPLVLDVTPGEPSGAIEVSVAAGEAGEGTEVLDVETGEPIRFGIDPRYLSGALAAIPSGAVAVGMQDHRRSLMLRPTDHPGLTFVVMPKTIPGEAR